MHLRHGIFATLLIATLCPNLEFEARAETEPNAPVEQSSPDTDFRTGVGLAVGGISGIGIAFRGGFSENWGFRVAGIGWATGYTTYVNLGLTLLPTVWAWPTGRVYVPFGIGATYASGPGGYTYYDSSVGYSSLVFRSSSSLLATGTGIGFEFLTRTLFSSTTMRLGIALELPFVVMVSKISESKWSFSGAYPFPNVAVILYL